MGMRFIPMTELNMSTSMYIFEFMTCLVLLLLISMIPNQIPTCLLTFGNTIMTGEPIYTTSKQCHHTCCFCLNVCPNY